MNRAAALLLLSVLTLSALTAIAQAPQAPLRLGRINFPTSATGATQAAFVRGVLNLHSFEYDEAILAFRDAQKLSPDFAMAYWGEALSYTQPLWYNENVDRARETLNRLAPTAVARAAKAPTQREKAYMAAIERLFAPGTHEARFQAFADAMAGIARDYPNDDEARVFQALAMLATIPEGVRRPSVSLKAGEIVDGVLKRNPQHPGAAHYVLHAYDDGEHNASALTAARIYAKIAPQSSHALHMPSHAFLPLGMWEEAAATDEASFLASVAWVKRTGRTINQQDFHSLSWLHFEQLQLGKFAKARETAAIVQRALDDTIKRQGNNTADPGQHAMLQADQHSSMVSEIGRGYDAYGLRNELANMRARSVIEGADWQVMKGKTSFDNIDELCALGLSSVGNEEYGRADAAVAELRKAMTALPNRDAAEVASIMADEISALLLIARGRQTDGLNLLANTAMREGARRRPIARPYPPKPAGELYAEALAGLGQPGAAVAEYKRVLQRLPRRPVALLGLAKAAAAAGDAQEARRAANEFLQIWRGADADRPELREARQLARTGLR